MSFYLPLAAGGPPPCTAVAHDAVEPVAILKQGSGFGSNGGTGSMQVSCNYKVSSLSQTPKLGTS